MEPTLDLGSDDDDDDDDVLKNIRIIVDHPDCFNNLSIINVAQSVAEDFKSPL